MLHVYAVFWVAMSYGPSPASTSQIQAKAYSSVAKVLWMDPLNPSADKRSTHQSASYAAVVVSNADFDVLLGFRPSGAYASLRRRMACG